ncbi:NAD(P)/FAD-dependent oxidoreductase [Mycolicibacterium diernhoferi]|uniref:FAD-dependent oxidoreductase n=3 Tax=Mycolicibacterium diernhoferi TaxID=1801 RepID=A0A1Q4H3Y3_9MYCO|nr:FAD-dependent oxidoreductase [Mycolicibacterium diernhoferi]OJZ61229.1 FAD-dependent oxidoreductase [Mycolicibacterium diernhoferi]PEG55700.1 FAD-dependent oxidoreductase [Mycolicibacterium diernhoferi]QYL20600.1 FAD-dependent oxidoreductase [Mycolicibacterium diernhoferi]
MPTVVIIGAGLAGAKAAEALRDKNFGGRIILFGDEHQLPYERPPLSKDYLANKKTLADFTVHPEEWYRDHEIDLRLGTEVQIIDSGGHSVGFDDGRHEHYDKLLLATGSRARRLDLPGADAAGVHTLRTVDDASALLAVLDPGSRLAIVGAGWIGLEVAAGARGRGAAVTVVEAAELPLLAALGPEVAEVFAELHTEHGVDLRFNADVQGITAAGDGVTGLQLADGSTVAADIVLIAVGAQPNIGLAEKAGLELSDGGVAVDASLQTSDPDIYAVGDIAAARHPLFGDRIRTEHWANALKQPAVAVAGVLGNPGSYDELPYFFTDQYDLGMEYVGHAPEYDSVVFRGDVGAREFTAFWLDKDARVLAGMNVNIWDGLDDIKALVRSGKTVDAARLADPEVPPAALL